MGSRLPLAWIGSTGTVSTRWATRSRAALADQIWPPAEFSWMRLAVLTLLPIAVKFQAALGSDQAQHGLADMDAHAKGKPR